MNSYKELYLLGKSLNDISREINIPQSTIRRNLIKDGVILRSNKESIKLAGSQGKMARSHKRIITKEWRKNISTGKINGANKWAKGRSLKPNGYIEITRGENKGRGEHVVVMESIIGRRLYANECVHHKDFVRSNNKPTNLELMTRSEHLKLHRKLDNHRRIRDKKGRFL